MLSNGNNSAIFVISEKTKKSPMGPIAFFQLLSAYSVPWLDDSRFALYCLSVLKLHGVMYSWLPLKKAFCFYGPLLYSWSGHVNLINRIYYDKYVHLNHEFYWNNVVLCFVGHDFFRSLWVRVAPSLFWLQKEESTYSKENWLSEELEICVFFVS